MPSGCINLGSEAVFVTEKTNERIHGCAIAMEMRQNGKDSKRL